MKVPGRCLDLLGVAVITSGASVFACVPRWIGDGDCDEVNNIPECGGYDGGDCCSCTCSTSNGQGCGRTRFACVDPEASCVEDDNDTSEIVYYSDDDGCVLESAGDGYCDQNNNFAECEGYDGGDCCESSCVDNIYDCGSNGYQCIDPDATGRVDGDDSREEDDDSADSDDSQPETSTTSSTFSSRNPFVGPGVAVGVVTLLNLLSIARVKHGNRDEQELLHSKLLLLAWLFSIAEGIVVLLAVPDSKESLKIGIVFMFSSVAAASGFCLRKAGRYISAAIVNAVLEGGFAAVFLFFFVERSMGMVFLMGSIAGNQALVGFAIARYVDAIADPNDEEAAVLCVEICFLVLEAIVDAIVPLTTALILSLFHPDSPWRSEFVYTWWGITGFANLSLVFMIILPPMNKLGYGAKLLQTERTSTGQRIHRVAAQMLLGSASKQNMFLLWLLVILPFALNIAAQRSEAGDVVDVTVTTNAFDTRTDYVVGCPPNGCKAENTRDGDLRDVSRWSCSRELVEAEGGADGEECRIVYEFSDALATVYSMSVAFYQGDERTRTMNVDVNGVLFTVVESGGVTSGLEAFELDAQDVLSVGLESVGLPEEDDFLSIIEVTFEVSEVGSATSSSSGATTPGPTSSGRGVGPAPSPEEYDGLDDDSVDSDDSQPETSTTSSTFSSRNPLVGPGVAVGVVTLLNLLSIARVKHGNRDEQELLHSKLLLLAWLFSIAEGIVVLLAVPDSKESLKIGIVFMFSSVAAASGFCLRKAGRYISAAIVNAVLEGGFAAVFLFFFVERSMGMVFLMGAIAGNQALVGFAIARYVDAIADPNDEEAAVLCVEICFLVLEAIVDAIVPLTTALILSLFHPDSPWRSEFVYTWWGITGFANLSLVFMISLPPMNKLGYGAKLLQE
eukprot:g8682.t1